MLVEKEIEEIRSVKKEQLEELQAEINELKEKSQEINEQIISKEQIISEINANRIPEITAKKAEIYFPKDYSSSMSQMRIPSTTKNTVGVKFKMESRKKGVLAYGSFLPNGNFLVLSGSIISSKPAPRFQTSAPAAFRYRQQYLNDGTINSELKFTRDVEFSSISGAAALILGNSANGYDEWKQVG